MSKPVRKYLSGFRETLALRPSVEDVSSVVNSTAVGAFTTAVNAALYAGGAVGQGGDLFLAVWLGYVALICVTLAAMSRKAQRKSERKRVSPRAARKLAFSSVLLALPWAALPVFVFGFHGPGDPTVVILVTTGMLAGGAFMLHRTLVAAICFMATINVALVAALHYGEATAAWRITCYSTVYFAFLTFVAYKTGATARQRDTSLDALSAAIDGLERAQDENHQLANIDDTTGLLNRKAFNAKLQELADHAGEEGGGFALLLMDLDRFKNVNDLFGHGVGDELLAEVGKRLRANVARDDIVARLGGDEFALILLDADNAPAIKAISDRMLETLNEPARLAGRLLHPGASIGAVLCPNDSTNPVDLLLKADIALNRAKEEGRGRCVKFDGYLRRQVIEDDELEAGLRDALDNGKIYVEYQPKITLHDGSLMGAEALVRWRNDRGEMVSPERFLALASERGLLPNLSQVIAEIVSDHIRRWRRTTPFTGKVALNVHPDDIKSPELFMEKIRMFEAAGVTHHDLMLEITEGCIIGRGTDAVSFLLDDLAERGYELSLDDFGTGHASLSHLKKIPVSEIKIDRSFVSGIELRADDRAIVAAIAEIARGLSIRSVAEGVENDAQRRILRELGIDIGQGYLWARPMGADQFASYVNGEALKAG